MINLGYHVGYTSLVYQLIRVLRVKVHQLVLIYVLLFFLTPSNHALSSMSLAVGLSSKILGMFTWSGNQNLIKKLSWCAGEVLYAISCIFFKSKLLDSTLLDFLLKSFLRGLRIGWFTSHQIYHEDPTSPNIGKYSWFGILNSQ